MELVGEFMGKDQDKSIWRYFRNHWHDWFPNLGSRSNFVKQSTLLYEVKRLVHHHLVVKMGAVSDSIHMVDGPCVKKQDRHIANVLKVKRITAIVPQRGSIITALRAIS